VLDKPGARYADAGDEKAAHAETDADALGKDGLVAGFYERGHHEAEDNKKRAGLEGGAEVSGVEDSAAEGADEEQEEDLKRTDPGY
jgi:hypothetical protein